jgi:hypothetical protein
MPAPSKYNFEICQEICARVSEGENIKKVLASDLKRYPRFNTWCAWKRKHEELSNLYTQSNQDRGEIKDAEIEDYKEMLLNGTIDPATARVLIDTVKWQAAKYYPKMFGDKTALDVTSGGDKIQDRVVRIEVVPMDSPKE